MVMVIWCAGKGAGASHNACFHIDSLPLGDAIILLTVFEMLRLVFLSVLQSCVFILPFYYTTLILTCCEKLFNAICFTRFIFVNSVIVSSNISCNDLSWNFNVMYVWYVGS